MCARCRHEILPDGIGSPLRGDMLRAPAKGMVTPADPKARRNRDRKDRKALRRLVRTDGIVTAAKFFLRTAVLIAPTVSEECPDCLKLQHRAA